MTSAPTSLISKVLVLDGDPRQINDIRDFCEANGLVALKSSNQDALSVLKSNVDLGAILLWENYGRNAGDGLNLGREIHRIRPELPIFLRREASPTLDDLPESDRNIYRAVYTSQHMSMLRDAIGESLFSRVYPTALVRGITEVTCAALEGQFRNVAVEHETPCLVKDRLIYGQLFSLIPLESSWCRGYMMLQTEEKDFVKCMTNGVFGPVDACADFREINNVLGEATNMVWGAFKNRFINDTPDNRSLSQVPIIVNHLHKYISFGSEEPLLCVKYRLYDKRSEVRDSIIVYQWFAFSLAWSPDNFKENLPSVETLCEAGSLELF
jgi:hypothetical protein